MTSDRRQTIEGKCLLAEDDDRDFEQPRDQPTPAHAAANSDHGPGRLAVRSPEDGPPVPASLKAAVSRDIGIGPSKVIILPERANASSRCAAALSRHAASGRVATFRRTDCQSVPNLFVTLATNDSRCRQRQGRDILVVECKCSPSAKS